MFELIQHINLSMVLEIPIAPNLQECPILIADYGGIIKEELRAMNGS